jgi:hypothetical protein
MVAEVRGVRVDLAGIEQRARDAQRQFEVAPGRRLVRDRRQCNTLVAHGIDQHDLGAAPLRVLQHRHQVHVADHRVLAPQHDVPRVQQVEQVVAVAGAEVLQLRRFARAGADVADFRRARPELIEEQVRQMFEDPQRTARAVVADRRRAGLGADRGQLAGDQLQRLVPARRLEPAVAAHQRLAQPQRPVLDLEEAAGTETEEAARDRVIGVAPHAGDHAVMHFRDHAAGIGAVSAARRAMERRRHGDGSNLATPRQQGRDRRGERQPPAGRPSGTRARRGLRGRTDPRGSRVDDGSRPFEP